MQNIKIMMFDRAHHRYASVYVIIHVRARNGRDWCAVPLAAISQMARPDDDMCVCVWCQNVTFIF